MSGLMNSAQQVPEPDLLLGIYFDTGPDPIQFWKSSGSGYCPIFRVNPEIPTNTQKYHRVKRIPDRIFKTHTRPNPNPTYYPFFSNTKPDLILKNATRWALHMNSTEYYLAILDIWLYKLWVVANTLKE